MIEPYSYQNRIAFLTFDKSDYLNLNLFNNDPPEEKDYDPNIFTLLEDKTDERLDFNVTKIIPIIPKKDIKELLKVKGPIIKIEDVGFSKYAKPILFSRIYWNGDFFDFHLVRKRY